MTDAENDRKDVELFQEMFKQAKSALEAQRASIERLRARITATTQQATTLAVAGLSGWAALSHTTGVPSAYSAALLAAEVLWLTAALLELNSLRTKQWAEAAMVPSDFLEEASPLDRPLSAIYGSLAVSFGDRFSYNSPSSQNLARAVGVLLSLMTAAPLLAAVVVFLELAATPNRFWGNLLASVSAVMIAFALCHPVIRRWGCLRRRSK